jgi:hypothetical protein
MNEIIKSSGVETEELLNLKRKPTDKDFTDEILQVVRENFVALCTRAQDNVLLVRFVSGQKFRLMVEEVL